MDFTTPNEIAVFDHLSNVVQTAVNLSSSRNSIVSILVVFLSFVGNLCGNAGYVDIELA